LNGFELHKLTEIHFTEQVDEEDYYAEFNKPNGDAIQ
jgi:hypothetical protein